MSRIVTLSSLLAKALLREQASSFFGVVAVGITLVALLLGKTDIGVKYKLFGDLLLVSQGYLLLVAALMYTFLQIHREQAAGLFLLPLANGMSRQEYLLARVIALCRVVGTAWLIFLVIDTLLIYMVADTLFSLYFWQLFLYLLSALFTVFIVLTLSFYVSGMNAVLYGILFFLAGSALDEFYLYTHDTLSGEMKLLAALLYYVLPNFSLFDLQGPVVNGNDLPLWEGFILPTLYFLTWSVLLFFIARRRFQKKALRVGG